MFVRMHRVKYHRPWRKPYTIRMDICLKKKTAKMAVIHNMSGNVRMHRNASCISKTLFPCLEFFLSHNAAAEAIGDCQYDDKENQADGKIRIHR